MVYYESEQFYIESANSLRARITRIDAIITALETTALRAAATGDLTEYSLDDGQTKIRTVYSTVESIIKAIKGFEQLRQMYIQRLTGRVVRLVDGKSFINTWGR